MTTKAEMIALAKAVEDVVPSDELRRAVLLACGWEDCDDHEDNWRLPDGSKYQSPQPLYSLDAAVALMPAGWVPVELCIIAESDVSFVVYGRNCDRMAKGFAPDEPRARTAAALRARAQEMTDD